MTRGPAPDRWGRARNELPFPEEKKEDCCVERAVAGGCVVNATA